MVDVLKMGITGHDLGKNCTRLTNTHTHTQNDYSTANALGECYSQALQIDECLQRTFLVRLMRREIFREDKDDCSLCSLHVLTVVKEPFDIACRGRSSGPSHTRRR